MVCEIPLIRTNKNSPQICAFLHGLFVIYLFNAESALVCKGVAGVGGVAVFHSSARPIPSAEAQPRFCCSPCSHAHPSTCVLGPFLAWWSLQG